MKSIREFLQKKMNKELISMVTAYDYQTALVVEESDVDAILVGDSVAMVVHGHPHTTFATLEMMSLHTKAVCRGLKSKLVVADIPFLVAHKQGDTLLDAAGELINSGATAIKIEGGEEVFKNIKKVINAGIPVMGHLGLTPQSVHQLGGYLVQGRDDTAANKLMDEALELEKLGVFSIVLECVPQELAREISNKLTIPVIGIGAGANVDGQILVSNDLLGKGNQKAPKFVKKYNDFFSESLDSLNRYHSEVLGKDFPSINESYQ